MKFDLLDLSCPRFVDNCCVNTYPLPEYHFDRIMSVHDLLYFIEGEWGVAQDGITYSLRAGDALFLRAGSHHYGTSPCSPYSKALYVHFLPLPNDRYNVTLNADDLIKYAEGNVACISTITDCRENANISRLMLEMINAYMSGRADCKRLGSFLMYQLLNELAAVSRSMPPFTEEWVVKLLRLFRNDAKRMLKLDELSEIAGVSVRTLTTRFREVTGLSIHQYQLGLKLDNAKLMLSASEATIQEIAFVLGFCDAYQFSRMFKKRFGLSPKLYQLSVLRTNINSKAHNI